MKKTIVAFMLMFGAQSAFAESGRVESNDQILQEHLDDSNATGIEMSELENDEHMDPAVSPNSKKNERNYKNLRRMIRGSIYGATLSAGVIAGTKVLSIALGMPIGIGWHNALGVAIGAGSFYAAGKIADQADNLIDLIDTEATKSEKVGKSTQDGDFKLIETTDDEVKELKDKLNHPLVRNSNDVLVDTFTEPLKNVIAALEIAKVKKVDCRTLNERD